MFVTISVKGTQKFVVCLFDTNYLSDYTRRKCDVFMLLLWFSPSVLGVYQRLRIIFLCIGCCRLLSSSCFTECVCFSMHGCVHVSVSMWLQGCVCVRVSYPMMIIKILKITSILSSPSCSMSPSNSLNLQ